MNQEEQPNTQLNDIEMEQDNTQQTHRTTTLTHPRKEKYHPTNLTLYISSRNPELLTLTTKNILEQLRKLHQGPLKKNAEQQHNNIREINQSEKHKNELQIWQWNSRNLTANHAELILEILTNDQPPDIICIQETNLLTNKPTPPKLQDYERTITTNRPQGHYEDTTKAITQILNKTTGDTIICSDFKAHNTKWGSDHTDKKGERLKQLTKNQNLQILNTEQKKLQKMTKISSSQEEDYKKSSNLKEQG
ncbi:hypothetical protein CHS0354_016520 [Potamilus streckersoni]|uniref:Endonuclease/exonuclease/phosphatase domain-containing protein n=1 Tax=Potamilus streckersoni TaxID=2493646 RepID=A0AAE0VJ01_9BIVA|nr:hypothetical protein CHS0354_016520 [Potamilus streckersoni]